MPETLFWSGVAWVETFSNQELFIAHLNADGTDQSVSLQSQINAVDDGTADAPITLRLPDGNYRLDQTITLSGRNYLIIEGPLVGTFTGYSDFDGIQLGIVNGDGVSTRAHWVINGGVGCGFRRLNVRGPNSQRNPGDTRFALYTDARAFEAAYQMIGATEDSFFELCTFTNVWGDGFYVGGTGDPNVNPRISACSGTFCGRQQVGFVNGSGGLIEDVHIEWGGRSGLDVEPNHDTHFVTNLTLRRVTMGSQSYPFVLGGDAGDSGIDHVTDVLFEDCVGLNASSAHPAVLANARDGNNLTIRRHTDLRQRSTTCLQIGNWSGTVLVEDCVVTSGVSTPPSYGVTVSNCDAAVTIRRNTFNGPTGAVGVGGADNLYQALGTDMPSSVTHCGNVWNMSGSNDGTC